MLLRVIQSDNAIIGLSHSPMLHNVPLKQQAYPVSPGWYTPTLRIALAVGEPGPILGLVDQFAIQRTMDAAIATLSISQRSSLCGSLCATAE